MPRDSPTRSAAPSGGRSADLAGSGAARAALRKAKSDGVRVIKGGGRRNTQRRLAVYEAVLRADQEGEHPDPAAIYKRVRAIGVKVALSSVYRALTTLEELGLLRRYQVGDRSIYE